MTWKIGDEQTVARTTGAGPDRPSFLTHLAEPVDEHERRTVAADGVAQVVSVSSRRRSSLAKTKLPPTSCLSIL